MKEEEKGAIGESILGEGGGEDFLRYFKGTVFGFIGRSWKFRARSGCSAFSLSSHVSIQSTTIRVQPRDIHHTRQIIVSRDPFILNLVAFTVNYLKQPFGCLDFLLPHCWPWPHARQT
jgi:hypothetical protein